MAGKRNKTENTRAERDEAEAAMIVRRRVLRLGGMAAAGAGVAAIASAVNASPAAAATGNMQYGASNNAVGSQTELISSSDYTFVAKNYRTSGFGASILGWTNQPGSTGMGVYGFNTGGGPGVVGEVNASGNANPAVVAVVNGGTGPGVRATAITGAGVEATTGDGVGVDATSGTGVALYAHIETTTSVADAADVTHNGKGRGVKVLATNVANAADAVTVTHSGTGKGVNATTGAGTAFAATAGTGIGLLATANTATSMSPAVKAQSNGKGAAVVAATTENATLPAVQSTSGSAQPALKAIGKPVAANGGTVPVAGNAAALSVQGVAVFTRSNVVSMTTASTTVSVPGGLTAASHVLSTMQTKLATTPQILAAVPNAATGKITIYLSAAPSSAVNVAWFVFG